MGVGEVDVFEKFVEVDRVEVKVFIGEEDYILDGVDEWRVGGVSG